jgi:hypothetical protein
MRILLVVFFAFAFTHCSNNSDPEIDKLNFTRVYDNNRFNTSYYPIDMKQTPDGGYLILGGRRIVDSNFSGIYILKTDATGNLISELEVDQTLVNPVGPLHEVAGNYYFFCMTSVGLQTQLLQLQADGTLDNPIDVGSTYPAASAQSGNNFLLLSYDNFNKQTVISEVNTTGAVLQSKGFSIGAGDAVEEPIINHFLRTGRQFPFFVGRTSSGLYYFNGFYNYTLSLVFTNLSDDEPQGIVQGQQDDGGISQLTLIDNNKFALSRFNFGENYFLPNATLNNSGISSSSDLGGNTLPELTANTPVKILRATIGSNNLIIYGSNTRSKQIALFAYKEATGEFVGSRYLGFSNPFEIASITRTDDKGIAICGTTYVAGRFPRICLFKLSEEEVIHSFQ